MKLRKKSKLMTVMTEQLRRAAEQAARYTNDDKEADARLEMEAKQEEKVIKAVCDDLGLVMFEASESIRRKISESLTFAQINPDGHCLYAAIADQLRILNIVPPFFAHYGTTRAAAAAHMMSHPDDFLPFLPSLEGEDGVGAGSAGLMTPVEYQRYCENVRSSGVWGGEPEILALSRAYNVPIHVVQAGTPNIVVHDPSGNDNGAIDDKRVVRISYHRRMYGLGEVSRGRSYHSISILIKTFSSTIIH